MHRNFASSVHRLATLTLPLLAAFPLSAQERTAEAAVSAESVEADPGPRIQRSASGSIGFEVDPDTGLALSDFVKLTAEITGKRLVYQPRDFQSAGQNLHFHGKLEFVRGAEEFYEFAQRILFESGFACVAKGTGKSETVELIHMAGPKRAEIGSQAQYVPAAEVPSYRHRYVQIMTSVRLNHINAQSASNSLRPFFAQGGGGMNYGLIVGSLGDNRSILLQGFGPQVAAALRLLAVCDVPVEAQQTTTRVVRLEHVMAGDLLTALRPLLTGNRNNQQFAAQHGMPMPAELEFSVAPEQNAVLLEGMTGDVKRALTLIAQLDIPKQSQSDTPTDTAVAASEAPASSGVSVSIQGDQVELRVAKGDQLTVQKLVAIAHRVTGRTFTYRSNDVARAKDGLELVGTIRMPRSAFLQFFKTLLGIQGFEAVPADDRADSAMIVRRR